MSIQLGLFAVTFSLGLLFYYIFNYLKDARKPRFMSIFEVASDLLGDVASASLFAFVAKNYILGNFFDQESLLSAITLTVIITIILAIFTITPWGKNKKWATEGLRIFATSILAYLLIMI